MVLIGNTVNQLSLTTNKQHTMKTSLKYLIAGFFLMLLGLLFPFNTNTQLMIGLVIWSIGIVLCFIAFIKQSQEF